MPRFFIDRPVVDFFRVTGKDARHIEKSLRMRTREVLTLCHGGVDYICEIANFEKDSVVVELVSSKKNTAEPKTSVTLLYSLPKGDKMDLVVQKAVEVGVCAILPVLTKRCVSRPDEKTLQKKVQRWQKIAQEAAQQSGRGAIPKVCEAMDFSQALNVGAQSEKAILFYEGGGKPLGQLLAKKPESVSIFIGPEGGFDEDEVQLAKEKGLEVCSLGERILRTETAAIVASALTIYETDKTT